MRVVWLTSKFLDYAVALFRELDALLAGELRVIFSSTRTAPRVTRKAIDALGPRAVALTGQRLILDRGNSAPGLANRDLKVWYQSGLLSAVADCRPDVLIGEGFAQWTTAALAYRLTRGTPLVVSYERTAHTERAAQWYRTAYRRAALRLVDVVCCNGRLSSAYCRRLGLPPGRIVTGRMAADTEGLSRRCAAVGAAERQALRRQWRISGRTFLYVGQLIERKGVRQLLAGWSAMRRRRARAAATLVIAGDGGERASLAATAEDHGLTDVRFVGGIDYDQIAPYYALADVFVIPTLEDNWSLVVPEAMSCGLPVLCSKYNGCWPELVHDGTNGFVFDPCDAGETARRLGEFLDHPESIGPMGSASRRIVAGHSPRRAAESVLRACRLAVSLGRRRAELCG